MLWLFRIGYILFLQFVGFFDLMIIMDGIFFLLLITSNNLILHIVRFPFFLQRS